MSLPCSYQLFLTTQSLLISFQRRPHPVSLSIYNSYRYIFIYKACLCTKWGLKEAYANSYAKVVISKYKLGSRMCAPLSKLTHLYESFCGKEIWRHKLRGGWLKQIVGIKGERHYCRHDNTSHNWFHIKSNVLYRSMSSWTLKPAVSFALACSEV